MVWNCEYIGGRRKSIDDNIDMLLGALEGSHEMLREPSKEDLIPNFVRELLSQYYSLKTDYSSGIDASTSRMHSKRSTM